MIKSTNSRRLSSAAIALCMIAFFTIGSVRSQAAPKKQAITINSVYTARLGPTTFTGTFTMSGAVVTSGTARMEVHFIGPSAHCLYTFESTDGSGTIIIQEQCNFTT